MPPMIYCEEAPTWETLQVEEGDVLSFDYLKNGARSYLAVAGGIAVPVFMHSRSTYTLIGLGGHEGRALQEGDELEVGEAPRNAEGQVGKRVDDHIPTYPREAELRVIIGLASYRITEESMDEFLSIQWTVTPDADRLRNHSFIRHVVPPVHVMPRARNTEHPFARLRKPTTGALARRSSGVRGRQ
jgi:allophanate hydrolase subunit 2